jgi:hypothetical protein
MCLASILLNINDCAFYDVFDIVLSIFYHVFEYSLIFPFLFGLYPTVDEIG